MRDEKEGRKNQARSNKQQGKATQQTLYSLLLSSFLLISHHNMYMYMYMYIRATDRSKKRKVPLSHGEEVDIDVSSLE